MVEDDGHGHGHDDAHHPKHFSVRMVPGYMVMLLLLQTGMMGTFVALDMFLFYVFWEVMLLPMYFLIGIWGGPRKEYAAIKFFLYTLAGSVLMLLAIIGIYYNSLPAMLADGTMSNGHTFNLVELARAGRRPAGSLNAAPILGLRVREARLRRALHRVRDQDPDVPVPHLVARRARRGADADLRHPGRRAPEDGHLRHPALQLPAPPGGDAPGRPTRSRSSASSTSSTPRSSASAQKDLKKLIAYSSVSHMGFSLLGMAAMTPAGHLRRGAEPLHARHHQPDAVPHRGRDLRPRPPPRDREVRRPRLELPEYTAIMGLAFFASLGLPGLAGFISEFMVFSGAFPVFTTYTIISATSVIITAAYYLWAIHRMFLGKLNPVYEGYPDLNWRERISLYPLAALAIVLGFYPQAILGVDQPHACTRSSRTSGRCRRRSETAMESCSPRPGQPALHRLVPAGAGAHVRDARPVRARPRLAAEPGARRARLTAGALAVLGRRGGASSPSSRRTAQSLFNGMVANDAFAIFFKWLFLAAGALTVLIAAQGEDFPPERIGAVLRAAHGDRARHVPHGERDRPAHDLPRPSSSSRW